MRCCAVAVRARWLLGILAIGSLKDQLAFLDPLPKPLCCEAAALPARHFGLGVSQASPFWQTTSQCQEPPCRLV